MKFNRVIKLFLLVSLLVMAMTSVSFAGAQDFTLKNNTGYTIRDVYICPTTSKSWGEDYLGREALLNGESIEILFNSTSTRYWDLLIVFSNGSEREWARFDLLNTGTIILERDGAATYY